MTDKYKIGLAGELLVHKTLKGSKFINEFKESGLPYDIEWQGLKLSVKTTMRVSTNDSVTFSDMSKPPQEDVILVLVAIWDNKNYFWIEKPSWKFSYYKKLSTALNKRELRENLKSLKMSRIALNS